MMESDSIVLFGTEHVGLAWVFQVNPESCGNSSHYEEYIRFTALGDKKRGKGTTHVFLRKTDKTQELLGYITLRATSFVKFYEDKTPMGSPAIEIFELAVSQTAERQGVGSELVKFALTLAHELNQNQIGIQYVTLCADDMAVPFYEKFHFARVDEYGEVPRENWNKECVPMFLKLPELP